MAKKSRNVPVAPVVPEPEVLKCRQCGSHVGERPKAPSVNCLVAVRNQLEAKEGRRSAAEEQVLAMLKVIIHELNVKGPFTFCAKCQEAFAQLIGNPERLWMDLFFARKRWEELHAEAIAEAEKKKAAAQAEQERRLRQAEESRMRQEEVIAAKASSFLASFETPEARQAREQAEAAKAEADRKADEWLKRLVEGKILLSEVGYVNLASFDPRNSIEECRVPGCNVRGTATSLNDKGRPIIFNVAVPVIACRNDEPIVKDGQPVLTKPRVVILCGRHAHRAREISIEVYGEERAVPYYQLIKTLERFLEKATIGRATYKLGDVPGFPNGNGNGKATKDEFDKAKPAADKAVGA